MEQQVAEDNITHILLAKYDTISSVTKLCFKNNFVADILQFIVSGLIWDICNVTHFLHHDKMWHYDFQVWGVVHLLPVGEDHDREIT